MNFRSVLYDDLHDDEGQTAVGMPAFFVDLNLDQVVNAITARRNEYNLTPFFYSPIRNPDLIDYRQKVFQDLEKEPLNGYIKTFAQKIAGTRHYLSITEKMYFKYHQEGWILEAAATYCDAVTSLVREFTQARVKSRGLSSFRDYLTRYAASPQFIALATETEKLKSALSAIQYSIIIHKNWVRVRKYEGEIDYSRQVEQCFEKFKQGGVKDHRANLSVGSGMNHIEGQILDCVARLYPEIFDALDRFCNKWRSFIDETILVFEREIQFYLSYLDYITGIKEAGVNFCYPQVSPSKELLVRKGFDLALAHKLVSESSPVVTNDFYLRGNERIIVISGPNQGGKTTFARTFGQLHFLASLGCPVPGVEANLFQYDKILTHFEREEDIRNLRGKLQDDLVRIHHILEKTSPQSIVIMNEIFTSTSLQDAVFLSKQILEQIIQRDALSVCVSFIDELTTLEKTVSMVSTIVPENPAQRTFKIIRKPADGLSYAISIAEKHGVTYDQIMERMKV